MSNARTPSRPGLGARTIFGIACALLAASHARAQSVSNEVQDLLAPRTTAPSKAAALDGGTKSKPAGAPALVIEETDSKAEPPPPVPVGEERRAIGEYIQGHSDDVHDCYAQRLREMPALQGKLIARFQIGPSGRVIGAKAEGINDAPLAACVVAAVRKWEFEKPASGGKLSVAYPYIFKPIAAQ